MRTSMTIASLVLAGFLAAGCDDGPAEDLGESIDDTANDMGNAVEDACEQAKESADAQDTDC